MKQSLPENIEVVNNHESFIIRRKWFTKKAYFMLFFTICWNSFMVVWMTLAFADKEWTMAAFGSLHAGVGVWLIYFTTASFLNTTDILVNHRTLSIQHRPLPWLKPKPIPIESIRQAYTKQHVIKGDDSDEITYRVIVVTQDRREHKLVTNLATEDQARYIEQEIETILGLEDLRVVGEVYKASN
ncbi:MAG: hypothetical protein ACSHX8_11190 [Opitutaceae bacterium]